MPKKTTPKKKSKDLKSAKHKFPPVEILRHSLSHVLAQAVLEMFPEAKLGIGPATDNGFYYDFDLPRNLIPEDLPILEKKVREAIKKNYSFEKKVLPVPKVKAAFEKVKQPYKVELLRDLERSGAKDVSLYKHDRFVDLRKGRHLDSTGEIDPECFKLNKIAGAYWKGSEKNKMLQRIYGLAFSTPKELKDYEVKLEEIKNCDHRKLGKALDLYSINNEVGAGLILLHPKGAIIRNIIEDFWRAEHRDRGYEYVYSPHLGKSGLWQKSGHLQFYKDDMYGPMKIDNVEYRIKPMNCPFHVQIYRSDLRSYRDLPIRYGELGTVYRYEREGTLHGLLRVRGFTQDDAHIFCRVDQLQSEIEGVLDLALYMLKSFGFKDIKVDLSVRDPNHKEKYLGSDEGWTAAEKALEEALKKKKLDYNRVEGEAVFYAPKIDLKLVDSLGRDWQGPTIQVDFNLPQKFDLHYIDKNGKKQQVFMIHRTVLGSMERFLGNLIEHYAGEFPLWLAPVQVQIISVSDKFNKFSEDVYEKLKKEGIRVELNTKEESVGKKIAESIKQKIPYVIVLGEKEKKSKKLAIRKRGQKKISNQALKTFTTKILKEIEKRS